MASNGLADSNMLVRLTLGGPSGIKAKKRESQDLADSKNADQRLTKVVIHTFKKQIEPVKAHQQFVRQYFNNNTLPWGDGGQRLVNNAHWEKLRKFLEEAKMKNQSLYAEFLDNMPRHIESASRPGELGDLFDRDDFKTREELLGKWKFQWDEDTVPDAEHDVRAGWSPQQIERMKTVWKEQEDRKTKEAMSDVTERVQAHLSRISDRLGAYNGGRTGSFKDTMIGNMRDLANLLPAFNLTNDPELEAIHRQIMQEICPLDPKELRKSPELRAVGKRAADDLLARIGSFGQK